MVLTSKDFQLGDTAIRIFNYHFKNAGIEDFSIIQVKNGSGCLYFQIRDAEGYFSGLDQITEERFIEILEENPDKCFSG